MPDNLSQPITQPSASLPQPGIKEEITSLGSVLPPKKPKKLKIILSVLGLFLLFVSAPLAVYLVKQRQEIRKEAVGPETIPVNIVEDDKGEFGISGEAGGQHPYCCVTHDTLEVSSPKEGFWEVDKIAIESHDHTASVAIKLDIHNETGWQTVDTFDVSTGSPESICDEEGPYFPDHGYPSNPNTQTHSEPDSCYQIHTTSLDCQKIDRIRMNFYSTDGDSQKDKGEHVHIKNAIWHFCPAYEISCLNIVPYSTDWKKIGDEDWADLVLPTTVNFVVGGSCDEEQGVTKARFRINNGDWQEVDDTSQKYQGNFYWPHVLSGPGVYTVEAEVYNPKLGWK